MAGSSNSKFHWVAILQKLRQFSYWCAVTDMETSSYWGLLRFLNLKCAVSPYMIEKHWFTVSK